MTPQTKKIKDILGEFFLIPKKDNHKPDKIVTCEKVNNSSGSPSGEDAILKEVLKENDVDESDYNWTVDLMKQAISLSAEKTKQKILKVIKDLRFTGRFKGIDKETDMAYRKGYNNALEELKQKINGGDENA